MIIRTKSRLSAALLTYTRLQSRQIAIGERLQSISKAVLDYYRRKGRTSYRDPSGIVWRKQQNAYQVYKDDEFKKLLKEKGIPVTEVYKKKTVEERDDAVVMRLLKEKRITVKEWKQVVFLRYSSPYLRKYAGQNKGRGKHPSTGSGLSASETVSRVRDRSKTGGKN